MRPLLLGWARAREMWDMHIYPTPCQLAGRCTSLIARPAPIPCPTPGRPKGRSPKGQTCYRAVRFFICPASNVASRSVWRTNVTRQCAFGCSTILAVSRARVAPLPIDTSPGACAASPWPIRPGQPSPNDPALVDSRGWAVQGGFPPHCSCRNRAPS